MTDPFIGEIRPVAFDFAPPGWLLCQGQILSIQQYTTLFALLGTMYGGNGTNTFALPDLRGNAPVGVQQSDDRYAAPGYQGGAAAVTLLQTEMPAHGHSLTAASTPGTTSSPTDGVFAVPRAGRLTEPAYGAVPSVDLAPGAFATAGGSQPHNNMQPFLVVNFIIAYQGVFPSRG